MPTAASFTLSPLPRQPLSRGKTFLLIAMSNRSRSRSRSRSQLRKETPRQCDIAFRDSNAVQARRLDDYAETQRGRFLQWDDSVEAEARRRRCLKPSCPRGWTTTPYCLWIHFACASTDCIQYLHSEVARICCELRSLDADLERKSMQPSRLASE